MKKQVLSLCSVIFALLICLSFVSCSKATSEDFYDNTENGVGFEEESKGEAPEVSLTDQLLTENTAVAAERKIIKTIDFSVQTKEYDDLIKKINNIITELDAYVEKSDEHGNAIDSDRNRTLSITIRIPAEKTAEFDNFLAKESVVTSRSVSTEDVTLSYVDMESRVSALEIEKAALEGLLGSAKSTEEILQIREQLTQVIYEMESIKSKLKTYDNLVDYSTVNVNIYEVERTDVVEELGIWEEITLNLKENFEDVWEGCIDTFIFAVSAIPYLIPPMIFLLVLALVVLVIVKIILKQVKNKKKK